MRRLAASGAVLAALLLAPPSAVAAPLDDTCAGVSPTALPCVGFQKLGERLAAECRRVGRPASQCRMPLGREVADDVVEKYRGSWLHRTALFQYQLGNAVTLRNAAWVGTHNSFNSVSDEPTLSKTDSNQQLSMVDQLESDIRSLEIDLHWAPDLRAGAAPGVIVCHGRGAEEANAGCTNERPLSEVLPPIANWLRAHPSVVVLLYLEDDMDTAPGYARAIQVLDSVLKRSDGSSMIYRPRKSEFTSKGCANLPLSATRDTVRARRAQVVLVGNCRAGWSADVFGWDDVHVESGATEKYRAFPECDASYGPDVYAEKLVRYYEDSTWVATVVDPTWKPEDREAELLNPNRVREMTRCGVNLFGFDQFLPNDGRIEASIWSWAKDQPNSGVGDCAAMLASGRWATRRCDTKRRTACRTATGFAVTKGAYTWARGRKVCVERGERPGRPRTGNENSVLRTLASGELWLDHRVP